MAGSFSKVAPQPGDGAWLTRNEKRERGYIRPSEDNMFLGQSLGEQEEEDRDNSGGACLQSGRSPSAFSTNGGTGKSKSRAPATPHNLTRPHIESQARTIRTPALLSPSRAPPTLTALSHSSRLLTFLRQPVESPYTHAHSATSLDNQEEMAPSPKKKGMPPHLRGPANQAKSTTSPASPGSATLNDSLPRQPILYIKDPKLSSKAPQPAINGTKSPNTPANDSGVSVIHSPPPPKAAPVNSPPLNTNMPTTHSNNESKRNHSAASNTGSKRDDHPASPRGGRSRGRGRGRGRGANSTRQQPPRESRWPKASESKPDPKRWETNWESDHGGNDACSSVDSACADAGWWDSKGARKKTGADDSGYQLTDWSGGWAPAPVDWDCRPAFRDGQSAQKIEGWLDGITEAMRGKDWEIPTEDVVSHWITYTFSGTPSGATTVMQGDPAPRYWIPVKFGDRAPQTFWNEFVKSDTPTPVDEDDLLDVRPWWETYVFNNGYFLRQYQPPRIAGIDPDEENDEERIARQNDHGSDQHAENRKRKERAKIEIKRERRKTAQEKLAGIPEAEVTRMKDNQIKPGVKLYVRTAKPEDIPRIREIYNYYVDFSACVPEMQRRTDANMRQRLNDIKLNQMPFLVACERGTKPTGRRKKNTGEQMLLPDKVVGFAFADDFNDMRGMYRFTAEMEVYVDKEFYMKGVASCLLDQLVRLLDPDYIARGGYEVIGDDLKRMACGIRRISTIIINLSYDKAKPERLEWMDRWLSESLGFKKAGEFEEIGLKNEMIINLAMFQRKTGEYINPKTPPIMMEYPTK